MKRKQDLHLLQVLVILEGDLSCGVPVRRRGRRGTFLPPDHRHPRRELVRPLRLDDVTVRRRVDREGVSALGCQLYAHIWAAGRKTHTQEHFDVGARNHIGLRDVDDLRFPLAKLGVQVQVGSVVS